MRNFIKLSVLALAVGILAGCHSDIDINNLDPQAEVSMGLVVPVGSVRASVGDLLQLDSIPFLYYDTVNSHGALTFKTGFTFEKNFHQVDLAQYISTGNFPLKIHDKVSQYIMPGGYVPGTGMPITIDFPLTLKLDGINSAVDDERLDSAIIENAQFVSRITQENLDDLKWEWIEKIELDLGDCITRKTGNRMTVFDKNTSSVNNYGVDLPVNVDNFTICLMKDRTLDKSQWDKYPGNVVSECTFHVYLTINIPMGQKVTVPEEAKLAYDLSVKFIDFKAIWGMFSSSSNMSDADSIDLSNMMASVPLISKAKLPFASPSIDMSIATQVAGAITLRGDYLYTRTADNQIHYASFNGSRTFEKTFEEGEYLDPNTSEIGSFSSNMHLRFDTTSAHGKIDELFQMMPHKMGYMFRLDVDRKATPQMRITPTTGIKLSADVRLPMAFNAGMKISYSDTIRNVDLSQISIDSLLGSITVIDTLKKSDVHLLMTINSTIPFRVKALLHCIDANGDTVRVTNADGSSVPFQLFSPDTILINPPHYTYDVSEGKWIPTPIASNVVASLSREKLDVLTQVRALLFTLWVDNESLDYAYNDPNGRFAAQITADEFIEFKLGLTAQLDAVLNFNNQNANNNTNTNQ